MTTRFATSYIVKNYGSPRHDMKALTRACNKLAKEEGLDAKDLFLLLIENKPMGFTHSYGFQTAYGRELIQTLQNYYHA